MNPKHLPILLVFLAATATLTAQDTRPKKYPSLLWEITGNGLKEASYLFGTMHVSSKMVFHLSDSFYNCIRNSEMVALELDPAVWQTEMVRMQKMETNLRYFSQQLPRQYLNEKSFQLRSYEERIQEALSDVPYVINSLLYRSYQDQADFEEDTYLDLYIYQTGKKLGKLTTGVENYYETEKLIIEAYQDMAQEKKKKTASSYMEAPYEIEKKAQEAYRKGDLDLLDSLERILQSSEAFMEKFLYLRNEIQANSIDTILRKHSLFVGVGAAHLPGERGVIELLRRKGYQLRPIVMQDRDAEEKERIDKMRVKVDFQSYTADDGLFSVMVPGPLYRKEENMVNQGFQFADMSNGSYYMVNRVRTNAPVFGHTEATVVKKIDSLLYENIPGRIIKRTSISRNGYPGFDITNRTRRGDIQRYHIFVLPFDILVFKRDRRLCAGRRS
jgi:uncharacterized protein YbaP (TraB family)